MRIENISSNDYDVIVCKVLVYLYGKYKRIDVPDDYLTPMTKDFPVCQEMFNETLAMMLDEGLIKGFEYIKARGGDEIIVLENNIRITPTGIHYLKDNSIMRKIVEKIPEAASIASLFV